MNPLSRSLGTGLVLLSALAALPAAHANENPCAKEEAAPTRLTPEAIRERAKTINEFRKLLKDEDASVRLSALEAMLTSCNAAMREVGYDAAFGSGDPSMRALALKHKLLSMRQFVVELLPPETPSKDQNGLIQSYQLKHPVTVGDSDLASGNFSPQGNIVGTVSGLELRVQDYAWVVRMRLGEGAILLGTVSTGAVSVPARVALR